MVEAITPATDFLWRNGLAVIPLVLLVAVVTKFVPTRPATRHLLWAMVLLWLVVPPLVPAVDWGEVAPADRVGAASQASFEGPGETIVDPVETPVDRTATITPVDKVSDDAAVKVPPPTRKKKALAGERERFVALPPSSSPLLLYLDRAGDARFVDDSNDQSVACSEKRTPQTLARASASDRLFQRPPPAPAPKAVVAAKPVMTDLPVAKEPPPLPTPCADYPRYAYTFHPDTTTEPVLRTARRPSEVVEDELLNVYAAGETDSAAPTQLAGKPMNAATEPVVSDVVPSAWQAWASSLVDLRDAIRATPPVPMHLWVHECYPGDG